MTKANALDPDVEDDGNRRPGAAIDPDQRVDASRSPASDRNTASDTRTDSGAEPGPTDSRRNTPRE
jgi:hypothetical protein